MTLKAAVLGSPIAHSLSPTLHGAAYAALGLKIEYTAIETTAEELPQRIAELDADCLGYSLTMPLKQDVLALLDQQSRLVRQTGCANTVYRNGEKNWALENTDVFGISQTIKNADLGPLTSAFILGSGATASSALHAIATLGVLEITCLARNQKSIALLRAHSEALGVHFQSAHFESGTRLVGDLVISTVPTSAQAHIIAALAVDQSLPALLDIAYNPWPSDLAQYWARHHGGPVLSGIDMLLWQASAQVELFTGLPAPIKAMRAALPNRFSTG